MATVEGGAGATAADSGSWGGSADWADSRVASTPRVPATNRLTRTMATKARPTALSASAVDGGDGSGSVCIKGKNAQGSRHATTGTNPWQSFDSVTSGRSRGTVQPRLEAALGGQAAEPGLLTRLVLDRETYRPGQAPMPGLVGHQLVHPLDDPPVGGVALGGGAQLGQGDQLAGVHRHGEPDPVGPAGGGGGLGREPGQQGLIEAGRGGHGRLEGLGQPGLGDVAGQVVAEAGGERLPHDGAHPVPLEVPEGAVVGDDVEGVHGPLEGPAGPVAAVAAVADVRGQQAG